jgi:hypothetical protein
MPHLSPFEISVVLAGAVALVAYCVFIVAPAWSSYGRAWEKVAASFLTLFMLATLMGMGIGIGAALVYFYDQYA